MPLCEKIVLVVTNHFENRAEVVAFSQHLAALPPPPGGSLHLAVTDNSLDWAGSQTCSSVRVYTPPRNLGYLRGCHFALEGWQRELGVAPSWIVVSNTDVTFSSEFFVSLVNQPPRIVAPSVLLDSGLDQNPYARKRPSRRRMWLMGRIFANPALYWLLVETQSWRHLRRASREAPREGGRIYAAHGSVVAIPGRFFERGGTLDYGAFLFGEELYLAEEARRLEIEVMYEPRMVARHRRHGVLGRCSLDTRRRWACDSHRYLWGSYFAKGPSGMA